MLEFRAGQKQTGSCLWSWLAAGTCAGGKGQLWIVSWRTVRLSCINDGVLHFCLNLHQKLAFPCNQQFVKCCICSPGALWDGEDLNIAYSKGVGEKGGSSKCYTGQRGCQLPSFLVRMGAGWGDPLGSVSLPSDGMIPRPCLTACNTSLLITGRLPLPNPSPYQGRTLPCSLPARVREPQAATAVQPQLVLCVRPSQEQPFSAQVGMPILEPCNV